MKRSRSGESASAQAKKKRKAIQWDTDDHDAETTKETTETASATGASVTSAVASEAAKAGPSPTLLNAQRETLSAAQAAAPSTASPHLAEVVQLAMFDFVATARAVEGATPSWNTCYVGHRRRSPPRNDPVVKTEKRKVK